MLTRLLFFIFASIYSCQCLSLSWSINKGVAYPSSLEGKTYRQSNKLDSISKETPLRLKGGDLWSTRPHLLHNTVPLVLKLVVSACGGAWFFGSLSGLVILLGTVLSPGGVDLLVDNYGLLIPFLFMGFHFALVAIQLQKLIAVIPASSIAEIRRTLLLQVCSSLHSVSSNSHLIDAHTTAARYCSSISKPNQPSNRSPNGPAESLLLARLAGHI